MLKSKILLALFFVCGLFVACEQTPPYDEEQQQKLDLLAIEKYKENTNQNLTVDPSGLNYEVLEQGTGTVFPKATDSVMVFFQASILGSTVPFTTVLEKDSVGVNLNHAIAGWQIGLQKITAGGQIRLVIPSALAYKDFAQSNIPAFSILDYTITLVNIKYK